MLDRFTDRPEGHFQNVKYAILGNLCFAEFLSYCYVESKINETSNYSDSHPFVLNHEVVEENHKSCIYPKSSTHVIKQKLNSRTLELYDAIMKPT